MPIVEGVGSPEEPKQQKYLLAANARVLPSCSLCLGYDVLTYLEAKERIRPCTFNLYKFSGAHLVERTIPANRARDLAHWQ